jgi:hypothetical protein
MPIRELMGKGGISIKTAYKLLVDIIGSLGYMEAGIGPPCGNFEGFWTI